MEFDIFARFPDMKPVTKPPALFTVNGIGTMAYGRRDFDPSTGTYVVTHWFTVLFLPVIALGAYRVADAETGGWYFIGKVPTSGLVRGWTFSLLVLLAGLIGWGIHEARINSPEYKAERALERARELEQEGRLAQAALKYNEVALSHTRFHEEAALALTALVGKEPLQRQGDGKDMVTVFSLAWLQRQYANSQSKLIETGLQFIAARRDDCPASCLSILDLIATTRPQADDLRKERHQLFLRLAREKDQLTAVARKYSGSTHLAGPDAGVALRALEDLVADAELRKAVDPQEMVGVFTAAWQVKSRGLPEKKLYQYGLDFVQARLDDAPEACLGVLDLIESAAPKPADLVPTRRKILERLVKERPGDLQTLGKLAALLEFEQKADECDKLLTPHKDKLGTTEGARILGQIRARQGKHDEAVALLQPYTDAGLQRSQDAEEEYQKAEDEKVHQLQERFKSGTAAGFDYNRYNHATIPERQAMFRDWLLKQLASDPQLTALLKTRQSENRVVQAIFALGMAQLRAGQQLTDPKLRQAELEKAEQTFLKLKGKTGLLAHVNLTLGEIYCWMGRTDEGKRLFDEVLAKDNRRYETLMTIGNIYRNLGDSAAARKFFEEAHQKEELTAEEKFRAAEMRALSAKDTNDQLEWLNKSDLKSPFVKAQLASAQASDAYRKGDDAAARRHYEEALKLQMAMGENNATLNNGAIVCRSLFALTGDVEYLERSGRMQEKGVALDPRSSILAKNLADITLEAALRGLTAPRIDFKVLRREAALDMLKALYEDAAGRKKVAELLRSSGDVARSKPRFDHALVVAPSATHYYSSLAEIYRWSDDIQAMKLLLARAREARIDFTGQREALQEYYAGKRDKQLREELPAEVKRAEKVLTEARKVGGATFALAATNLVTLKLQPFALGPVTELDAVVKLAEEAHQTAPCVSTKSSLQSALLTRAAQRLAEKEPEFAAMLKRSRRSLGVADLLAVTLWREGKARDAALADADVRRVIELVRDSWKKFPGSADGWMWAMVKAAHPDEAAALAKAIRNNEWLRLDDELNRLLHPVSASMAFRTCWLLDSAGKTKEALAELKKCAAEGVPLPYDLP